MLLAKASMWLMKGWNSIDLASQLLLLVVILMRLSGKHSTEATFYVSSAACCAVLLWSKMLFFMMPFATTGILFMSFSLCRASLLNGTRKCSCV